MTTNATDTNDIIDRIDALVDWQLAQRPDTPPAEIPAPRFRFPVIDRPRAFVYAEPGREVLAAIGDLEPLEVESDDFFSMPVRLVINRGAGFCLEIGPYDLDNHDIEMLRAAIIAYDECCRPSDEYRSGPSR